MENISMRCLVCGRCQDVCPVEIHTDYQRIEQREYFQEAQTHDFYYLPQEGTRKAEVIYFAGCMSHLTPGIPRAMKKILDIAGIDYLFLDKDRSICCGRPLMLAGKPKEADTLIERNKQMIMDSGATTLVTSCPICFRVFNEEYKLELRILHHTQYLLELIKTGKVPLQAYFRKVAYHDPCELGRGSMIYSEPRELLRKVSDPVTCEDDQKNSLCCGGSLALLNGSLEERNRITKEALKNYLKDDPELLVTSCPLCKKTFAKHSPVRVLDIAELVIESIPN